MIPRRLYLGQGEGTLGFTPLWRPPRSNAHTICIDRACPGKHFALRTVFLNIACTLAVFDIAEPVGEKLDGKYHEGFFSCATVLNSLAPFRWWTDARTKAPSPVQVFNQAPFSSRIEVGQNCVRDGGSPMRFENNPSCDRRFMYLVKKEVSLVTLSSLM